MCEGFPAFRAAVVSLAAETVAHSQREEGLASSGASREVTQKHRRGREKRLDSAAGSSWAGRGLLSCLCQGKGFFLKCLHIFEPHSRGVKAMSPNVRVLLMSLFL